jgi:hypothetical protein
MTQTHPRLRYYRSRRGVSLIEVLVLVTGVVVMLGLCAVTIQLLLRLNADSQSRVSTTVTLERLARQLRDDAHASESARLSAQDPSAKDMHSTLNLVLSPSHSIDYKVGKHLIAREEMKGGKRVRHESYSLDRDQTARLEVIEESGLKLVRLLVNREPVKSGTTPSKPLEILAALSKHTIPRVSVARRSAP